MDSFDMDSVDGQILEDAANGAFANGDDVAEAQLYRDEFHGTKLVVPIPLGIDERTKECMTRAYGPGQNELISAVQVAISSAGIGAAAGALLGWRDDHSRQHGMDKATYMTREVKYIITMTRDRVEFYWHSLSPRSTPPSSASDDDDVVALRTWLQDGGVAHAHGCAVRIEPNGWSLVAAAAA